MIIRKLDELGRVVIPKEMRKVLDLNDYDPTEIVLEGSKIIITKHKNGCVFCGKKNTKIEYNDKLICADCLKNIETYFQVKNEKIGE